MFTITAAKFTNHKAVFLHITTQEDQRQVVHNQISNATDALHPMYYTKYGEFFKTYPITKADYEIEVMATFSTRKEAREYVRDSAMFFINRKYDVLNTRI